MRRLSLSALCAMAVAAMMTGSVVAAEDRPRVITLEPIDDGGKTSGPHTVTISLPPGYYQGDERYPVIYIFDGEKSFVDGNTIAGDAVAYDLARDQLALEGLIRPAILVGINNSAAPDCRFADLTPTRTHKTGSENAAGGKLEGTREFIVKLKADIDKTYRTRPEPASTGVAGASLGGLAAFWLTYEHPETFGMGCCMSPSFWWDKNVVARTVGAHTGRKPDVRLWIDEGGHEALKDSLDVCRLLLAQGFRQNLDLAFNVGHDKDHSERSWNLRVRNALYFLLREKVPERVGAQISEVNLTENGPMTLGRIGQLLLETRYDHGFVIADCDVPAFKSADTSIAKVDSATGLLLPVHPGTTTISAECNGKIVEEKIVIPEHPAKFSCPLATSQIAVDGDLSDWPRLPYASGAPERGDPQAFTWMGPDDLSFRFGCIHDDHFLYIAVQTTDDHLIDAPGEDPWWQDGIEVRLDARPAEKRIPSVNEDDDILLIATTPQRNGEARKPFAPDTLPRGTRVVCKATPNGHVTEIAVPADYLNAHSGKPWNDVRINVTVDDIDQKFKPGVLAVKLSWQPAWHGGQDLWDSGTFVRVEKQ